MLRRRRRRGRRADAELSARGLCARSARSAVGTWTRRTPCSSANARMAFSSMWCQPLKRFSICVFTDRLLEIRCTTSDWCAIEYRFLPSRTTLAAAIWPGRPKCCWCQTMSRSKKSSVGNSARQTLVGEQHELPQLLELAASAHPRRELVAVGPGLRKVIDPVREGMPLLVAGGQELPHPLDADLAETGYAAFRGARRLDHLAPNPSRAGARIEAVELLEPAVGAGAVEAFARKVVSALAIHARTVARSTPCLRMILAISRL